MPRRLIRQGEGPAAAYMRDYEERVAEAQKVDAILLELGQEAPTRLTASAAGGDRQRLRGLPAVAPGVSGAVPGTRPEDCIDRLDQEHGRRS